MKIAILALNSSYTHTCLSARILRCALLKHGFDTDIIELTINEKGGVISIIEKCVQQKYDVYCFSTYIWNRELMFGCIQGIKEIYPDCITIAGGPELYDGDKEFFIQNGFCDYLIKGEGEQALPLLLKNIKDYPIHTVLDGGECDDFEQSDEPYLCNKYCLKNQDLSGKLIYYESSRGCPFSCSYCLSSRHCGQRRVRFKPSEKVISELLALSHTQAKTIKLVDRTFNADVKRADVIFKALIEHCEKTNSTTTYHFEMCADLITPETVEILKKAPQGLFRFEIGVQSISKAVLKEINRNFDPVKTLEKIRILKQNTNIPLHIDLICGLPHETLQSISQAFDKVYPLASQLQTGFLKLLPSTDLRQNAICHGIVYLKNPPYTVLKTNTMSFEDINTMRQVDAANDVLSNELYSNTRAYIMPRVVSPYDFFLKLSQNSEFFSLAGKRRYGFLLEFICDYFGDGSDRELLRSYLLFDFLLTNQGTPPKELYTLSKEQEYQKKRILKDLFFSKNKNGEYTKNSQFEQLDFASSELYNFEFSPQNTYILDRKHKIFKVLQKIVF